MASRGTRPAPTVAVGVFLLAAVAFGLAASFLAGPVAPVEVSAPPTSSPNAGFLGFELASVIILVGFVAWVVYRIALGVRRGTLPVPAHAVMLLLTMFAVAVLFVVLFHAVGGTAWATSNRTANVTGPGTTPPPITTTPGGNLTGPAGITIPGWTLYAGFALAAVVVVVLALPYLVALRREPGDSGSSALPSKAEVRAALGQALADLDASTDVSANRRIIAAYASLLVRFEERRPSGVDGTLATMTPRDVEQVCVQRLRVGAGTAHELTGLFEEARYSHHPLGEEAVVRARTALRRALEEIDQGPRLG